MHAHKHVNPPKNKKKFQISADFEERLAVLLKREDSRTTLKIYYNSGDLLQKSGKSTWQSTPSELRAKNAYVAQKLKKIAYVSVSENEVRKVLNMAIDPLESRVLRGTLRSKID